MWLLRRDRFELYIYVALWYGLRGGLSGLQPHIGPAGKVLGQLASARVVLLLTCLRLRRGTLLVCFVSKLLERVGSDTGIAHAQESGSTDKREWKRMLHVGTPAASKPKQRTESIIGS